jgi:Dolichyl-phosphate-mannose-protein mannosyltransferase
MDIRRLIGPVVVAATALAMGVWTWNTWPDPVADFGKELYIAWQLSLGQRLYLDVAYHLGPLSPYFNALVFKIFGSTLATIEWVNLCVAAGMLVLVYRLLERAAGDLAAAAGGVLFSILFAFAHYTQIADYNYVCPYDHEHTHGLLLGLAALTLADGFVRTGRRWKLWAAGVAVGLTFLTRAEFFVAAFVATVVILMTRRKVRDGVYFVIAVVVPILAGWGLLAMGLPARTALRGICGSWVIVLETNVPGSQFYRESMGMLDVPASLERLGIWTFWWALALGPPAVAAVSIRRNQLLTRTGAVIWAMGVAYVAGLFSDPGEAFAPLTLATVLLLWASFVWRQQTAGILPRPGLVMGMAVWALALLGKIFLNARVGHYGFALAMPATLLAAGAAVGLVPELIRRRGGDGVVFTLASFGALVMVAGAYLGRASQLMELQSHGVGEGRNFFWADDRGEGVEQAYLALRQRAEPGQTLAVMPEGAMLNFLLKMRNPTPYWSFNPPYSFFAPGRGEEAGQRRMLAALEAGQPDWVVLVAEDLWEFGARFFGQDYGKDLYQFVSDNYNEVWHVGPPPFSGNGFGILLMHRNGSDVYNATPTAP